jgi:hypothetical protein
MSAALRFERDVARKRDHFLAALPARSKNDFYHSGMMSPGVTRPLLAPLRSHLSALRRGTWMPTERFAMRHVRDVIRLKSAGMPTREIARRLGTVPSTVRLTIRRSEAAGLSWPLPDGVTDTELEARLFASAGAGLGTRRGYRRQAEPDWAAVHRELRRKHVTLSILWEEYIAGEPGGYRRYSRFCELYRAWESHRADFRRGARHRASPTRRRPGRFEAIGGVPALLVCVTGCPARGIR